MKATDDKTMISNLLFAGTHGHVIAMDKETGRTVWSTSLPRTGYSVVSIVVEDGLVLCASGGHVFALDPADGWIKWNNELPGMGRGMVYLSTEKSSSPGGMELIAAQAAANAAAAG